MSISVEELPPEAAVFAMGADGEPVKKPKTRRGTNKALMELFAQEVPSLPLYSSHVLYVQRTTVRDARPGLVTRPGDRFWQVYQWYVKTK